MRVLMSTQQEMRMSKQIFQQQRKTNLWFYFIVPLDAQLEPARSSLALNQILAALRKRMSFGRELDGTFSLFKPTG